MTPEELHGLISNESGAILREHAQRINKGCIVEIGSFQGKSTAFLAQKATVPVYAIDPWNLDGNIGGRHRYTDTETFEAFEKQLKAVRLWSKVTRLQAFSVDAANRWTGPQVGLLYIDGDHTYEGVRDDLNAWTPHLLPDAVIILDDYETRKNPGVAVAAGEYAQARGLQIRTRARTPFAIMWTAP